MSDKPFPWRTLLVVSAGLNLLLIGGALGAFGAGVRLQRETPVTVVERMPSARALVEALPAETQPVVREEMVRSWGESRDARQAALLARREAFDAVAAEPYDIERVKAAFARMRQADQAAIGIYHDNVAEAFATMTPLQRREALAAMRRAPPARRATVAPVEVGGEGAGAAEPAPGVRREEYRDRIRERMRERREERREERRQGGGY